MNQALIQKPLNAALVAVSVWFGLAFIYVALFSLNYPFGMEWLEGHVMEMVVRSAKNQPIYMAPTLEYVPFIYTPFYYHVAAIFTKFLGLDFIAGRSVSILSTLGITAVLFSWVRALGGTRGAGLAAAGTYLAGYQIMGRWYDLARVDNLYVLLLLSGLYMLHTQRGAVAALVAAGLFAFAFYTKQSAPMAFAPMLLWAALRHRKDGLVASAATTVFIIATIMVSDFLSGGWFSFYVFGVPAGHGLDEQYLLGFFSGDVIAKWWPLLIAAIALSIRCCKHERELFWACAALGLGLVGSSYLSRIHWGGYVNVLIPMAAFFALVAGMAITRWWPAKLLVLLQFALLYYPPNELLPNDALLENNQKAIAAIADMPGELFIPELHFIDWPQDKKTYVYGMAAFDIFRSDNKAVAPVKELMVEELKQAFASHRFAGVMPGALLKLREANPYYTKSTRILPIFRYPTGLVRQQNPILLQLPTSANMSLIPPSPGE